MQAAQITATILTYNEAPNIGRVLERLGWCGQVLILDSGSNDETLAIAARFTNVRVEQRAFDNMENQRNHLRSLVRTPWALALDADYLVSQALADEILALPEQPAEDCYEVGFRYLIAGHPLRGSLYPAKRVFYRPQRVRYVQDGHAEQIEVSGAVGVLRGRIDHDDRKPLSRWLMGQDRYAREDAAKLLASAWSELRLQDKLRRLMVPAPLLVVPYTLLVRGVILDGLPGWRYALERLIAECLLALRLIEARLSTIENRH